jgi:outer membrane protein TolC
MTRISQYCFFILLSFGISLQGQEILSLKEAIKMGLENNYNIRIARNNEAIADNNNTAGAAGFLPTVSTTGNLSRTINNTKQVFFSGDERSGTGAATTRYSVGARVSWTAFDGFQMYATRDRLEFEEQRSKAFTESAMQDLATQIQSAYFSIVRMLQQRGIIEESIQLNLSLKELAENKVRIGTGTSLDVLQTTTRLNTDSSALLNLQDRMSQAKLSLNRLIGRDPGISFNIPDGMPSIVLPQLSELTQLAIVQNYDLKLLSFDEQIALSRIKEARSALFPTVTVNANYDYNFSKAEVGFLLSNRSFGPTIGLTATYDIFTGRSIKKDLATAELIKQNAILNKENLREDIKSAMAIVYQNYQALLRLQELELRNLRTAETNTTLARQLYSSGRATNFEVREAILSEIQIKDRISDVQFQIKLAEIDLKSMAGIPMYSIE